LPDYSNKKYDIVSIGLISFMNVKQTNTSVYKWNDLLNGYQFFSIDLAYLLFFITGLSKYNAV
jgi:hypothetical protein